MTKEVLLKILNRDYILEDDGDELLLNALGKYVEEKMVEVIESRKIVDTSKVAVISALLIAKELFELKSSAENFNKKINQLNFEVTKIIEESKE